MSSKGNWTGRLSLSKYYCPNGAATIPGAGAIKTISSERAHFCSNAITSESIQGILKRINGACDFKSVPDWHDHIITWALDLSQSGI